MKTRHVFKSARERLPMAMAAARDAGIADDALSLVARDDIELDAVSDEHKQADTDFVPATLKGGAAGGAAGLLAGLAAVAIPGLGVTLAGAAAIAGVGAATGGFASSLVGAALPDPVRRQFEAEIKDGWVLVLADLEPEQEDRAREALAAAGAKPLPYEQPAALS